MKLLIALMAFFCLITYSNTAQATDWYYVSPDDKGNQLFIDNDSVQKSDYDAVLWLKVNEPGGDELRYKVYISRYNRTMEILEVDAYMPTALNMIMLIMIKILNRLKAIQMVKPSIDCYGNK